MNATDVDYLSLDVEGVEIAVLDTIPWDKENGFYVESGAHDGEYMSNTLLFERVRNWNGLLIEPLPASFEQLQYKHRKAYTLNACLSVTAHPGKEFLTNYPLLGTIVPKVFNKEDVETKKIISCQCVPLYSVLLAMNATDVDYLSLDVEGVEIAVLDTIPWDKVNINMLSIDYDKWPNGETGLCRYMEYRGYECLVEMSAHGSADVLFRKIQLSHI